jgi:integrase
MSVRKRTWITKGVEKSAWVVDYTDQGGKRRLKSFAKKKEADAFASTTSVEVRQGIHVADSATVTVEEAGKLWLAAGAAAGLERTSLDQRKQHLNLHIVPFIGTTKLSKINHTSFVRGFQDKLREEGRSPAMVKRVTISLGSLLANAQEEGLVVRNVVHELSRSTSKKAAGKVEKRQKPKPQVGKDIPTNDEVKAILAAAEGTRWHPLLLTAAFTGMRASELRGLRWDNVKFKDGIIKVLERADRYHDMGATKSEAGNRDIPVIPIVLDTLKKWQAECPKGELGLVFPTGAGKIEGHSNIVNRGFLPIQVKAGVAVDTGNNDEDGQPILTGKYGGIHALRHWFASWCINKKADGGLELPAKAVQARMGHSNIAVTLDTYSHLFPAQDEKRELEAAQQAFFGAPTAT